MYNKRIIRFGFCDIQNNQGLRLRLITLTSTLITKTSLTNCLLYNKSKYYSHINWVLLIIIVGHTHRGCHESLRGWEGGMELPYKKNRGACLKFCSEPPLRDSRSCVLKGSVVE